MTTSSWDKMTGKFRWYSPSSSSITLGDEQEPLLQNGYQGYSNESSPVGRYESVIVRLRALRNRHREFLAEYMGTLVLILLSCGISAEQILNIGPYKSWLTSSLGNGLAVLVAICVAGHVSGAHINPAVTLTFWAFSGFPSRKVPTYILAQILGAFTGAALLYSVIQPAINEFDGGVRQILGDKGTANIFATYPPLYVGTAAAVASEIVGTALLLLVVMVSGHPNNLPFRTAQGVMIAAGIMAISLALGYTSGFSLNPARDFGPRLFTALAGWGTGVFSIRDYYAFVPMFAPLVGGLIGGLTYTIFIDQ
ncbi:aquaporin-like protein [Radiomyces spectabilis]|uniref:aquaporin-like protein n=1 Tax=Radiomyces spectabilis TaxID=64574 RepID=UPI00221F058B|nr:aquaporin-like protein [Radiomyces spectabilis]KAI8369414.1 aquaporin-like protein [Radiomyces spectabilis]